MTLAGRKQVYRKVGPDGGPREDIIGLRDEHPADAAGLLEPVMQAGRVLKPHPTLAEIRNRCGRELAVLTDAYKDLERPADYPVKISSRLSALQRELDISGSK
jgi:nicotinate phosphoribosyltransferase